ncbi:prolactin-6A1-like isoform X1 [Peromyscus leucopus]|uniref:prolactin-6A1-like isoform X1 n=1 Tax=Peromyscus leucopus TaxID=10041 RepID=UPI0018854E69|nr:prolactin-6A1-like isoform X1 [Peromyscus leucopus]
MRLTFIQPHSSGTLLVLLVSNLVLWENVASIRLCPSWDSSCHGTLKNMFDYALSLSSELQNQTVQMLHDFLQDIQYTPGRWYLDGAQSSCHTSTFAILLTEEETGQMQSALLLQEILTMLGAWNDPLSHAVTELSRMEEAPTAIIAKANIVDTAMRGLQEGIRRILGTVNPRFREVAEYPVWKGLASLQSPDEDLRVFAFHNLFQCLSRDSRKINGHLKLLKCRFVYDRDC